MTDERMDARLRAAGAAWRSATEAAATGPARADEDELLPAPPRLSWRRPGPRWTLLASAAVVAAALAVGGFFALRGAGDGDRSADQAGAIEGTVWRLLGYDDQHRQPNSTATLYVGRDGKLVADDSCSLITGRVDTGGGRLAVSDLDVRPYNCTDSVGEADFTRGLPTLRSGPRWSVAHGTLTISGAGHVMHLAAAEHLLPPTADRPTLTGATWRLSRVTDAHGVQQPITGAPTLRIDRGRLVASDSCNTISGAVRTDGSLIEPTGAGLATTEIGCPPEVMATADVVDAVFAGAVRATVLGATMTLERTGAGTLQYTWVPDDEHATDPGLITGRSFFLEAIAGRPASDPISLNLAANGRIVLAGRCDPITGQAQVGPGTLTTSGLPADAPAGCSDDLSTVLSFVSSPPTLWSVQRGKLVIYGGSEQGFSAVFRPATPLPPAADRLTGPWHLTGVEQTGTASSSGHSADGTVLSFDGAGRFRVNERCRYLLGRADITASAVAFSEVESRQHSCPFDPNADAEEADLQVLRHVLEGRVTWSIHDGQLTLKKGNVTLTFER